MKPKNLSIAIVFLLLGVTLSLPLMEPATALIQTRKRFRVPKPPQRGAPSTAGSGASRTNISLTALAPIEAKTFGGYTLLEQPTLWFYNPYIANPSASSQQDKLLDLKLILRDVDDQSIDSISIPLPETSGNLSIRLPENVKLQTDRPYHWILQATLEKPSAEVLETITVDGWIQRDQPNQQLVKALEGATAQERLNLYRQNELWFDAITTLAELRSTQPEDKALQNTWTDLLTSAEIPQAVIDCSLGSCKPQPITARF